MAEPAMKRRAGTRVLALCCAALLWRTAAAEEIVTDVNIVTGLDISNSVDFAEMKVELAGMARAIRDPAVLAAIRTGRHRRIGFTVFAWHHQQFPVIVSWTLIETADDAREAARRIEARQLVNPELEGRAQVEWYIGRLTDLSQAIEHADRLLAAAPFKAGRAVINIVGDGKDNVGEDAQGARDRFVAGGGTINGIVLGDDPAILDYYRGQVVGGRGAFVMSAAESPTLADAFVRKFIGDIVAGLAAAD
jgi:hypothetical protein